jgi:hypothetical protein
VRIPGSTLEGLESSDEGRVAVWFRRGFLTLLFLVIVGALFGLLGVHTTTSSASEGPWSVSVEHAGIARPGLDVPFDVTITHQGGFDSDVVLAVTADYFDIFESQGVDPEPSDETEDGSTLYLTFNKPPGDTLTVSYDIYVQPASQIGRSGSLSVVDGGRRMATVDFKTFLIP